MARRPINGNGREKFQCLVAAASDRYGEALISMQL